MRLAPQAQAVPSLGPPAFVRNVCFGGMAGWGMLSLHCLHASWEFGSDLSIPQIGKVRGILVSSPGRKDPQTEPNCPQLQFPGLERVPPAAETSPLLTLVRSSHHHRNQRSSLIPDLFRAVSGFGMTSITESIRASPWLSLIQELKHGSS